MGKYMCLIRRLLSQRGATAIMIAVMMVMFLGLAALAVDVGFTLVTRNQLQNVSDAASLAATRKLGSIYEPMFYTQQQDYVCGGADLSSIISVAQQVAIRNEAAGRNINVNDADVIIGTWDPNRTPPFEATLNQPDAVRVIARRDSSAMSLEGPITTFFAKIFGTNTLDVKADAIAALTGESTAGPGGLPLPLGISERWFLDPDFCGNHIRLYPSCPREPCDPITDGCGGWTTYTDNFFDNRPPNAAKLREILIELQTGLQSPYTGQNTMYEFVGGTLASVFPYMKQLFDTMRVRNDGILDSDNNPNTWTTKVVIYRSNTCVNPTGDKQVIGFATVVITDVLESPDNIIEGMVLCDNVEPGRGGGGKYGTKGSIPGLVE